MQMLAHGGFVRLFLSCFFPALKPVRFRLSAPWRGLLFGFSGAPYKVE